MIHKPSTILKEIATFVTLEPGDIVMTGTPAGVSTYERGDRFDVELFNGDGILLQKDWTVR
jgi:2-keto-4-pentenoate hydratase/2-oxohepta-3-ene-1,7-dioic acid hydratase in catechol pathway